MRYSIYVAALALAGPMCPATAQQQAPEPATEEIVVTGERNVERQARDFVTALTPSSPRGQLARFESEVCPGASGMTERQKAKIEQRLRVVATAAGAQIGNEDCAPNAILIVVDDKEAFLRELLRSHSGYFGDLSQAAIHRLAKAPGPASAWQLEGQVNARGVRIGGPGKGPPVNQTIDTPSRITAAARPVFEAAILIVESRALEGLTTTQLADYAAMRLLARTDPARLASSAPPTIVKILDAPMGSPVPVTLTPWDLGFLRGFYASQSNLYSGAQRSEISQGIFKVLGQPQD